jgi:hypothetical protein
MEIWEGEGNRELKMLLLFKAVNKANVSDAKVHVHM